MIPEISENEELVLWLRAQDTVVQAFGRGSVLTSQQPGSKKNEHEERGVGFQYLQGHVPNGSVPSTGLHHLQTAPQEGEQD